MLRVLVAAMVAQPLAVDALPQGTLVRSPSVHNTVINSREFLAAILGQLG